MRSPGEVLEELSQSEWVDAAILYRLDGEIIAMKISRRDYSLLGVLQWMENQVKHVLRVIEMEGLDNVSYTFKTKRVLFYPASRSTVLAVITEVGAHQQLLMMEIFKAIEEIRDYMS
ncbi:MAG: hypothetical protein H5T47_01665 [Archaeoglobi archaeon]|nr:hypothetical protein [Candidatus Mnemosynella bozhongmuii]